MKKYQRFSYSICSICLILVFLSVFSAESTQTTLWTTSTFDEFQQGKLDRTALTKSGEVLLSPETKAIMTLQEDDLLIWTLIEDLQGNIYAGTGDEGKIFKITPAGDVSLFFDSPEIGIISLAVDAENNLYAGSTPDGLIYKVTPEGNAATYFMTGEHYVWSLVFGADNVLYAGTGESGKIFTISPDGTGEMVYDSPQAHVMSLVYDPQGWLYAGTEGQGVVYKISPDGTAFALYHAKEEEVHSLVRDNEGNLYIAALSSQVFPKVQGIAPTEAQPAPKEKGLKSSTIYRISPQGTITTVLQLQDHLIYAMILDEHNRLLIGTDHEGIVYRVHPDGEYYQLLKVDAGNVVTLLGNTAGLVYLGTSDAGAVYQVSAQLADQGEYLSAVHDASTVAAWGKIFWRGTPLNVNVFTRTGNTAIPDDTWSQWSAALQNHDGEQIPNPAARFVQWKAVLKPQEQDSPVLEEVSVAYLPHNLAPEIKELLTLHAAQEDEQNTANSSPHKGKTNSPPSLPAKTESRPSKKNLKPPQPIPPGQVAIVWDAEDPNDEDLIYTVTLRGEHETRWKVLEENVEETYYLLDTAALPDGSYYTKIIASDSPNNPPDRVLLTEKMSERFEVDNTAPNVSIALNQRQDNDGNVLMTIIARDEFSRLKQAAYSVDAGEWMAIFPNDQVTDSHEEKYSVSLSDLSDDPHTLTFKVTDIFNNIGVGKIQFSPSETLPQQE